MLMEKEMNVEYIIREMRQEDLDKVTLLEKICFSQPWKYKDFEDVLTNPHRVYLTAVTNDGLENIIGGCMLTEIVGEGDISNVAVNPEFRGNHVATSLLDAILSYGRERWNIKAFTLEVRSKNEVAIKLYENAGFESAGIRPNFYDNPKDDAVIMWLK